MYCTSVHEFRGIKLLSAHSLKIRVWRLPQTIFYFSLVKESGPLTEGRDKGKGLPSESDPQIYNTVFVSADASFEGEREMSEWSITLYVRQSGYIFLSVYNKPIMRLHKLDIL